MLQPRPLGYVDARLLPALRGLGERRGEQRLTEQRQVGDAQSGELARDPIAANLRLSDRSERPGVVAPALAPAEPLGRGLRPSVASIGDLARMLAALGREQDLQPLQQLRRLSELERSLGHGIDR